MIKLFKIRNAFKLFFICIFVFCDAYSSCLAHAKDLPFKSQQVITRWMDEKMISGYNDGSLKYDEPITKAELATFISKLFSLSDREYSIPCVDVPNHAWYFAYVNRVVSANLMNTSCYNDTNYFYPDNFITREEAAFILANAYRLSLGDQVTLKYTDAALISPWAKNSVAILSSSDYIFGKPNGTFDPTAFATRLDIMILADRMTEVLINSPGTYSSNVNGNLIIHAASTTLTNMSINGNLYLTEGIGKGSIILDNVKVKGTVFVNGCGENSLLLKNNSHINTMIIKNDLTTVRLVGSSKEVISNLILRSPTILDSPLLPSDDLSLNYILPANNVSDTSIPYANSGLPDTSNPSPDPPDTSNPNPDPDPPDSSNPNPNPDLPDTSNPNPNPNPDPPDSSNPNPDPDPPDSSNPNPDPDPPDSSNPNPDPDPPDSSNPNPDPDPPDSSNPNPDPDPPDTSNPNPDPDSLSNLVADFSDYPSITLSWDAVTTSSTYLLNISNDSNSLYSTYTSSSLFTLDSHTFPLALSHEYTISITTFHNEQQTTTTGILTLPIFNLSEANNSSLILNAIPKSEPYIPCINLKLGIIAKDAQPLENLINIWPHGSLTKRLDYSSDILMYDFSYDDSKLTYSIPIKTENAVLYTLTILSNSDNYTHPISRPYHAEFLHNGSYAQLISTKIGTADNPALISNPRHLNNLSYLVNHSSTNNSGIAAHYKLVNDISFLIPETDYSSEIIIPFTPIGIKDISKIDSTNDNGLPFKGVFDGGNHTLSYLSIDPDFIDNPSKYSLVGLFAFSKGTIKNVTLDSTCKIISKNLLSIAGGIVAYAEIGSLSKGIENCHNYATIEAYNFSGGIVGYAKVTSPSKAIKNCYNYATIEAHNYSGGIIGYLSCDKFTTININDCYNQGNVSSSEYAGGIVGLCSIQTTPSVGLYNCTNVGDISSRFPTAIAVSSTSILPVTLNNCVNQGSIFIK